MRDDKNTTLEGIYAMKAKLLHLRGITHWTQLRCREGTNPTANLMGSVPEHPSWAGLGRIGTACLLLLLSPARASTLYVDASSANPTIPYADWSTAATNIQSAVDAAADGDTILVTNGIYSTGGRVVGGDPTTNRVAVTKALLIQSVNGPAWTMIQGYQVPGKTNAGGSVRCVYLTNNAALAGFTLANGAVQSDPPSLGHGGGLIVFGRSPNAVVSNCIVVGNTAISGGGAYGGTLLNCTIISNYAAYSGGGVYGCVLTNCLLAWNTADSNGGGAANSTLAGSILATNNTVGFVSFGGGGGANGSFLTDCTITANTSAGEGGGVFGGTATNCKLVGNRCSGGSGGGACVVILNNCLIIGNVGNFGAGVGAGTATGCVIVSNFCLACSNAGADVGTVNNSIVRYNFATNAPGIERNYTIFSFSHMNYCCTLPLPTGTGFLTGNITNDPGFADPAAGDYQLQSNSPCINSGGNAYNTTVTDRSGNPRVAGGTVDIGPYEYQTPSSILSYAWAQQYGLPTDASEDYSDLDGTGMLNWQKSAAALNPTNPASVLVMSPDLVKGASGVTVSWQSVNTRAYYLQRAGNLTTSPAFSVLQSNLLGQGGTTSFTDTSATNGGPYFYRVGVQ